MSSDSDPKVLALRQCREHIQAAVLQRRLALREAAALVKTYQNPAIVDEVVAQLQEESRNLHLWPGTAVTDRVEAERWYLGPREGGHWQTYRELLARRGSQGVGALDAETTHIVGLLAPPTSPPRKRRGLVMGNVQSGKTRNFAGVIAKAVDAGYKLVIVLSGINNNLRDQTQSRLDSDLFYADGWYPLTGAFDFTPVSKPQELFKNQPALCAVVKKNSTRLKNLVGMMRSLPLELLRTYPVLIVDDEADQATPNSKAEQDELSTINSHLRDLWSTVSCGTYLAYTATPFANVLMDPEDEEELFPADFITTIEPGEGYFGAERVFGIAEDVEAAESVDGAGMVRPIPTGEAAALRPPSGKEQREAFDPELPASLRAAFDWFVVASAIRRTRGDAGHSSMLIHTTHYTGPHFALQRRVQDLVRRSRECVARGDVSEFRAAWGQEMEGWDGWGAAAERLADVLEAVEVIVDNGLSEDRLNYDDRPRTVVAIGGGTLARGLTLEGLVVSYFTRTANSYDTLMQMGRWFGYRPGYTDLPRVWVSEGLDEDYAFLARVERDLRDEISSIATGEFTPQQVGVKIRAHPGRLQITSANKMAHSRVVQLGLSGTFFQTFLLQGNDQQILDANRDAVVGLVREGSVGQTAGSSPDPLVRGVPGGRVAAFLDAFAAHPDQMWLSDAENRARMGEWVRKFASGPVWNVVMVDTASGPGAGLGSVRIGGLELGCADRSVLDRSSEKLNFKAIMSPQDRLRDLDPSAFVGEPRGTDADRRRIRRLHGQGSGLIVVYPISANSRREAGGRRFGLADVGAVGHVLGFGIFFPHINEAQGEAGAFVSVRPDWSVPDVVEGDEALREGGHGEID